MSNNSTQAGEIIQYHVIWSMGAGAVPVPIADIAAVTAVQLDMLKQLSSLYGVDYQESSGKNLISAIAGSTLASIAASFVKSIPGVGTIIGGASMVILSGASTYAVGKVFQNHFEGGGSLFDFDLNWAKQKYDEEFDKGKEYASDIQQKETGPTKGEIFAKLDNLVKLKKNGVITDTEFQTKKEELLKKL